MGENAMVLVRAADMSVVESSALTQAESARGVNSQSLYNCEVFQYRGNLGSDMMFGKDLERLIWGLGMYRED